MYARSPALYSRLLLQQWLYDIVSGRLKNLDAHRLPAFGITFVTMLPKQRRQQQHPGQG
jgi:hypothetical protein